jgi:hypothetical protein
MSVAAASAAGSFHSLVAAAFRGGRMLQPYVNSRVIRLSLPLHPINLRKNFRQPTIPLDSRSRTIYIVLQERVALRRTRASRPEKGAIHEEESQEGRQESPQKGQVTASRFLSGARLFAPLFLCALDLQENNRLLPFRFLLLRIILDFGQQLIANGAPGSFDELGHR